MGLCLQVWRGPEKTADTSERLGCWEQGAVGLRGTLRGPAQEHSAPARHGGFLLSAAQRAGMRPKAVLGRPCGLEKWKPLILCALCPAIPPSGDLGENTLLDSAGTEMGQGPFPALPRGNPYYLGPCQGRSSPRLPSVPGKCLLW